MLTSFHDANYLTTPPKNWYCHQFLLISINAK
jgi:hypothetical protein